MLKFYVIGGMMELLWHMLGSQTELALLKETILEKLKSDNNQNRRLILEIDNIPIGVMNYKTVIEKVAQIGINICNVNQQEKGFGTMFLKMLISYLFEQMGYEKIILDTNTNNTRAQHAYEKVGFRKVAVNIDSWKNQLGELQSSIDYELTKEKYINSIKSTYIGNNSSYNSKTMNKKNKFRLKS